jgi:hypothetical protein
MLAQVCAESSKWNQLTVLYTDNPREHWEHENNRKPVSKEA